MRGQACAPLCPGIPRRPPLLSGSSPNSQKPPFWWPAIGNRQPSHRQPLSGGCWVHRVFRCESLLPQQQETGNHWDSDSNRERHCSMPNFQRLCMQQHRAPKPLCGGLWGALVSERGRRVGCCTAVAVSNAQTLHRSKMGSPQLRRRKALLTKHDPKVSITSSPPSTLQQVC